MMRSTPSAPAILEALACGQTCDCRASDRRGHGLTHCPNHADRSPSLNVTARDGRVLVNCRAGCPQDQVLDALRQRGLWPEQQPHDDPATKRRQSREAMWKEAGADDGTIATYLRFRGLSGEVPKKLRLHRCLPYFNGDRQLEGHHPAMLAPVQMASGTVANIHRTYLAQGGEGKAAVPNPKKLMTTSEAGAMRGAAIQLAQPTTHLALTEGIETGLAVMEATGAPVWSTVSAAGLEAVHVPESVPSVDIWADHDANGVGQQAARRAETRLRAAGHVVRVLLPEQPGTDWLDVLRDHGPDRLRQVEAALALALPKEATSASGPSRNLIRLSDVRSERVTWLWPGRIPLGKITLIDGDPGLGKSVATLDIAARVSTGRAMPDQAMGLDGAAGVVLLSAEDGLGDTIRPRLEAAGADLTRVFALRAVEDGDGERLPTLADLAEIRNAIDSVRARLVIVDPLMAYLPEKANAHHDQDVRRALAPLAILADDTGVAVVVVRHLNKSGQGSPVYRGGGSIGIIGAARSALLVAKDPDDATEQRRIMASIKCNLAAPPAAFAYRLETAPGDVARVVWEGTTEHTAAGLLAAGMVTDESRDAHDTADWLREALAGGKRLASEVTKEGAAAGFTAKQLRTARGKLHAVLRREGGFAADGRWYWALPDDPAPAYVALDPPYVAQDAHPSDLGTLGNIGHLSGGLASSNGHAPAVFAAVARRDDAAPLGVCKDCQTPVGDRQRQCMTCMDCDRRAEAGAA